LETGFQRLLREKGPIRNANLREGQGVPPIKIFDRIHFPRAQNRTRFHVAAAGVTERIEPAIGLAGHLRRALGLRSGRAFFLACQTFYAMRDRIAGLRNRLPGKPEIAGSTVLAYGAVGLMSAILVNDLLGPTPPIPPSRRLPMHGPNGSRSPARTRPSPWNRRSFRGSSRTTKCASIVSAADARMK
jgi:hypothetical protein